MYTYIFKKMLLKFLIIKIKQNEMKMKSNKRKQNNQPHTEIISMSPPHIVHPFLIYSAVLHVQLTHINTQNATTLLHKYYNIKPHMEQKSQGLTVSSTWQSL